MPSYQPRNILIPKPDTYGDIVLIEPLIRRLQVSWPDCRIHLLVREGYDEVAPLFDSRVHWLTTAIDPYTQDPPGNADAVTALWDKLDAIDSDMVLAGAYEMTWLEPLIADRMSGARKIAFSNLTVAKGKESALAAHLKRTPREIFEEIVSVDSELEDWRKWNAMAEYITGVAESESQPQISVPSEWKGRAEDWLNRRELSSISWIACCPAGNVNVPIKAWPAERFSETLREMWKSRSLPIVLMGHKAEREILESIAHDLRENRANCHVWAGEDGEISILAALISQGSYYFGNDTGAMHIAAALGIPVAAVFGGGTWPRFRPAVDRYAIVYQPLDCFGCGWECAYGTAPCLGTIPVEPVLRAMEQLLDTPEEPMNLEIEVDTELRRHGSFEAFSRYHSSLLVESWKEKEAVIQRQLKRIDELERTLRSESEGSPRRLNKTTDDTDGHG